MTIALQGTSTPVSSPGASSATITWPGSPGGQMLLAIFCFEGQAAGSGPYITSTVQSGWGRSCYQAPSATGNAIEVWNTQSWSSGPSTTFNFAGSVPFVGVGRVYTGQYTGAGNVIRAGVTAQVTGNNPAAPSVFAFANEMVIACASSQLGAGGYSAAPPGYSDLFDTIRGGVIGNVELGTADQLQGADVNTGSLVFTANAASGATRGTTATLVVRALGQTPVSTAPYVLLSFDQA